MAARADDRTSASAVLHEALERVGAAASGGRGEPLRGDRWLAEALDALQGWIPAH